MKPEKTTEKSVGAMFAKAAAFCFNQTRDTIGKIDPDIIRHLLQLPLLSYSLLKLGVKKIEAGEADGYPPLIYVHGLGGSCGDFFPMAWFLGLRGRKRSYKINFVSPCTLEEMAETLSEFIANIVEITGEPKVDLVCHSLGGLVGRLAIQEYGCEKLVNTYISLAAPHNGVFLARYARTKVVKDLRVGSDLIERVNKKPWPRSIRGICLYSHNDIFIQPAESAAIEGCENIDVSPFTHYSYLIDSKCWDILSDILCTRPAAVKQWGKTGTPSKARVARA